MRRLIQKLQRGVAALQLPGLLGDLGFHFAVGVGQGPVHLIEGLGHFTQLVLIARCQAVFVVALADPAGHFQ